MADAPKVPTPPVKKKPPLTADEREKARRTQSALDIIKAIKKQGIWWPSDR